MSEPVLTKADMYRRLESGEFGNANPQWRTIESWVEACRGKPWDTWKLWGIRSLKPADPRCALNVPAAQVIPHICISGLRIDGFNISPMVPGRVQWEGDVMRRHDGAGLLCSGNLAPEPGSWRRHMLSPRRWEGSAATAVLRSVLNENSYDDLMIVLDNHPDHVIELSALDICFGTVPGRNGITWECRLY